MTTMRMQFEIPSDKAREIDALIRDCGFENRKEFFNNAITLLKWAVRHTKNNNTIAAINKVEEKYSELEMPFLNHVRENAQAHAA